MNAFAEKKAHGRQKIAEHYYKNTNVLVHFHQNNAEASFMSVYAKIYFMMREKTVEQMTMNVYVDKTT